MFICDYHTRIVCVRKYLVRACLQLANESLQPFDGLRSFVIFANCCHSELKPYITGKSMVLTTFSLGNGHPDVPTPQPTLW